MNEDEGLWLLKDTPEQKQRRAARTALRRAAEAASRASESISRTNPRKRSDWTLWHWIFGLASAVFLAGFLLSLF